MRRTRRGDFLVPENDLEQAEDTFAERPPWDRSLDKAFRAPITDDVEEWEENPRALDYPGVDTPSDAPRESIWDFPLPAERARMATGRQDGVQRSPDPEREPVGLKESLQVPKESVEHFGDALDAGASKLRDLF